MTRPGRLLALNKPFDVLCQFGQAHPPPKDGRPRRTLAECVDVPGVYPAGRLDRDSEGLVLLTDDGTLQHRIADPSQHLSKRYHVQVDGEPDGAALEALLSGVVLKDGEARALSVAVIAEPSLWERDPPIRVRRHLPTCWLELVIDEGRNRQVRRMTAAVGCPTLRLVRVAIGPWSLGDLAPGEWRIEDPALLPAPRPRRRPSRQWPRSTE